MDKKKILEESKRCIECGNAPCSDACPSGRDIPGFIGKIKEGNVNGALGLLMENNPFPGSCGEVCPAPCQDSCILKEMGDKPVQIRDLERYVAEKGDIEIESGRRDKEGKTAVIGAGPAGLTAGYFLMRKGYNAGVYEELPKPGGMLRYGIPNFRLPREVLNRDIARIKETGLKINLESPVNDIDSLFDQGYDAIFVGIGAHKPRWMNIPGEELEGVYHATHFLREANLGREVNLGKRVAIIGCGDVAMDTARIVNKMGSEAFILYRRSDEEMPALEEEYKAAKREGVEFKFCITPKRLLGKDGVITSVECLETELGELDSSGRKKPIPIEESEITIEVDNVIEAVSQRPDTKWLKGNGLETTERSCLKLEDGALPYSTSREGVFTAGDAVTGTRTVAEAVRSAKMAVKSIEEYLGGLS